MPARVLDTNYLIRIWHGRFPGRARVDSEVSAVRVARDWLRDFPQDVIVTPVRLEFQGGSRDRDELRRCDLFLAEFHVLDEGRIVPADWQQAERLARRVPRDGRSRGAIDCLVRAICIRLHADMATDDTGVPG